MRVYLQWMRRLAVFVFFSVMFLFGMLSPNTVAVESQNATQENFIYTVKAGDTLYRIALEYGVTVRQLVELNDIAQPRLIRLGQKIIIPVTTSSQPFGMKYRVVAGDTLSEIALKYGVTVAQLVKNNQINNPDLIYVGQILTLPLSSSFTQQEILSAGGGYAVGMNKDGTVIAAGWNEAGQGNVESWLEIVSVSAGAYHTVGLKSDGTVVATGSNLSGESAVADWKDIVAISAGIGHTVGLQADGTVIATGNNENGECNVQDWTDIIAVSAGNGYTLGLKSDGKVVATGGNYRNQIAVSEWSDIVAISAGDSHVVGLKADGTVVVAGDNSYGQGDVSGWSDVIAVAAGAHHTVGLKSDGTVVATGYNQEGQCDVSGWKDMIAITAGGNTFGLRKDGTVAVAGENVWDQYAVLGWTNIGHHETESQGTATVDPTEAMLQQVANLLGESPDHLPSMIPLNPGYTYASAAAERTEYGYFVTFYETKGLVPINDAALNNPDIARQVATFEAIVYVNKSAATKAIDHHDASEGFSPDAPTLDLGYGIVGYQNSGMGKTLLAWNEGNWLLEVLYPIGNQIGPDLAKNIVDELESIFLPPPNDAGRIRVAVTSPSQTETMVMWHKNEVVYRIDSTNDPIDILDMTASIKQ